MSVYNKSGSALDTVYSKNGIALEAAYNKSGDVIFSGSWYDSVTIEEKRDSTANTTYYKVTIPQTLAENSKQYPFVYCPNGTGAATQSTLEMNRQKGFKMAINGGRFLDNSKPIGTVIQNGVVIQQGAPENFYQGSQLDYALFVLTIDVNGLLGYAEPLASASGLVSSGIVSALHGFLPIVINSQNAKNTISSYYLDNADNAQRQIIGQKTNGDYVIITAEGRNYNNSTGWTVPQATQICLAESLKYAFMLDGGGSTETVIGGEQINTIYEGTYGRKVPTYLVFNGTDTFSVPNN